MIETLWTFGKKNLRSRMSLVLGTTHPYLSGVIAIALVFLSELQLKPANLVSIFAPYDTVVFGFTATAIALAIAIPSERFVTFLSSIQDGSTPFKDFLFVLVWNGVVHIFAFFILIPLAFVDETWRLKLGGEPSLVLLYFFFLFWLQLYACFQFLVTTLAVYELADLYAVYCARQRKRDEAKG